MPRSEPLRCPSSSRLRQTILPEPCVLHSGRNTWACHQRWVLRCWPILSRHLNCSVVHTTRVTASRLSTCSTLEISTTPSVSRRVPAFPPPQLTSSALPKLTLSLTSHITA